jgi:hypothetical protein
MKRDYAVTISLIMLAGIASGAIIRWREHNTYTNGGGTAPSTLLSSTSTVPAAVANMSPSNPNAGQAFDTREWPHFSDSFIDMPYPPIWYYEIVAENATSVSAQFWDRVGGTEESDGGEIDIWRPVGTDTIETIAQAHIGSAGDPIPNTEQTTTIDGYQAIEYDFDYGDPGAQLGSQLYVQCGAYIISAYFWMWLGERVVTGTVPSAWETTAPVHAMFNEINVKSCHS